jgi:hypothetical protein
MSSTGSRGFSDAYGSWKTIWISRRSGRIAARLSPTSSRPLYLTEPSVAGCRLRIARPVVDLPQPDSPTSPSVSPGNRVRSMPSTALM